MLKDCVTLGRLGGVAGGEGAACMVVGGVGLLCSSQWDIRSALT